MAGRGQKRINNKLVVEANDERENADVTNIVKYGLIRFIENIEGIFKHDKLNQNYGNPWGRAEKTAQGAERGKDSKDQAAKAHTEALQSRNQKIRQTLKNQLEKRRLLEDRIMSFVGGKAGLDMLWDEMVYWAEKGEVQQFIQFALDYPKKAERMQKDFDVLKQMLTEKQRWQYIKLEAAGYEEARLLRLPFPYEEKCEQLLKNAKTLSKLFDLPKKDDERNAITQEELLSWYQQHVVNHMWQH